MGVFSSHPVSPFGFVLGFLAPYCLLYGPGSGCHFLISVLLAPLSHSSPWVVYSEYLYAGADRNTQAPREDMGGSAEVIAAYDDDDGCVEPA